MKPTNTTDREYGKVLALRYYRKKLWWKNRAFNHDFTLPEYFREMVGGKKVIEVADIGAGSICTVGNKWGGVEVFIHPSDLLAEEYAQLWIDAGKKLLIPLERQDMEALSYPDNSFDIVHCVNALDHCERPDKAIREMLRICKPGGWVYLRHVQNEGEHQEYAGFHQWNIDKQGDDCIFWNPQTRFYLSEFGNFVTEIKTEISNTRYASEESVVSRLRKAA